MSEVKRLRTVLEARYPALPRPWTAPWRRSRSSPCSSLELAPQDEIDRREQKNLSTSHARRVC